MAARDNTPVAQVRLNYWAGARAAAGTIGETLNAGSIREALATATQRHADPRYEQVLAASSLLLDGAAVHEADLDAPLQDPVEVDILPPFAGG